MDFIAAGSSEAATTKLYLDDTYLFEAEAQVVAFEKGVEEENTGSLILDRTCFHAQGGGQPTDEGEITFLCDGGSTTLTFTVKMVKTNEKQQVVHFGTCSHAALWNRLASGHTAVALKVNEALRRKYARLHSAGPYHIYVFVYVSRCVSLRVYIPSIPPHTHPHTHPPTLFSFSLPRTHTNQLPLPHIPQDTLWTRPW